MKAFAIIAFSAGAILLLCTASNPPAAVTAASAPQSAEVKMTFDTKAFEPIMQQLKEIQNELTSTKTELRETKASLAKAQVDFMASKAADPASCGCGLTCLCKLNGKVSDTCKCEKCTCALPQAAAKPVDPQVLIDENIAKVKPQPEVPVFAQSAPVASACASGACSSGGGGRFRRFARR